jgi:hypothetical protein
MNAGGIAADSALARVLDDYPVPPVCPDFADRLVAAAQVRPASLPPLRRTGGWRSWRLGQRIALGAACFGAVASAAAATGVLERFDIPVPSPQKVWASIAGHAPAAVTTAPVAPVSIASAQSQFATKTPVQIVGPIDRPEELYEAFRRIDEVRQGRMETRRQLADQRIANQIERRRAAGLRVPTAEEEAALRQRIAEGQARREQVATERLQSRRDALQRKVDSGEALSREDILQPLREDRQALQRGERMKRLQSISPAERREALRRLSPEERRALIDEYRARRVDAVTPDPASPPAG